MAYTHFSNDIFLSYRHVDNRPLSTEAEGWISRLHRDLETRIDQLGANVSMWRDRRLQGNDYFSDTIEQQLMDVAVLISVISPGYVKSDWCNRELRGFILATKPQGGLRIGTKSRLFKVLKTPTSRPDQPEALQQVLGYEFFHEGREFHLDPEVVKAEGRYRAKLDELARDIRYLLEDIRTQSTGSVLARGDKKKVYLAWATSDVNDERDRIKWELQDHGCAVFPDFDPPLQTESLIKAVQDCLEQCSLSVHPIGGRFGLVPEGEKRSLTWLQHDLAMERYKKGLFRRHLWMPPELLIEEPAQQEFVSMLEREIGESTNGFNFHRTSVEELKHNVLKELREATIIKSIKTPVNSRSLRAYLICESNDREAIKPVEAFFKQRGIAVDLPVFSGTKNDLSNDHHETLKSCDAVLVYHGNGSEVWLREKIRDCRKAIFWRERQPFLARGILFGPDPTPAKMEFEDDEFLIFRHFGSFSPESLMPIVSAFTSAASISA